MRHKRVIHIVDADRHALDRSAGILATAGYEVVSHTSGHEFLAGQPDPRPTCILLDIRTPEPDGLDIHARMLKAGMSRSVVVFTGEHAQDIAVRAMRAGGLDFLEKPFGEADLLNTVSAALKRLEASEDQASCKARALERLAALSPRETQVMDGMIAGSPNKIIAHELGLSTRTVEMYRTRLMDKLNAQTLSAVFRIWLHATPQASFGGRPV